MKGSDENVRPQSLARNARATNDRPENLAPDIQAEQSQLGYPGQKIPGRKLLSENPRPKTDAT